MKIISNPSCIRPFQQSDPDNSSKINHGQTTDVVFMLEPAADEKIHVINLPLSPEHLQADLIVDAGNLTRL